MSFAITVALAVAELLALYALLGIELTAGTRSPAWYVILLAVAFAIGLATGVALDLPDTAVAPIRLPRGLRWALFVPLSLATAALAGFALLITFVTLRVAEPIIDVESRYIPALVFIALAVAIAPARRRIVSWAVGGVWILAGAIYMLSAVTRPWMGPIIERMTGQTLGYYAPVWLQIAEGAAWLMAGLIPVIASRASVRREADA